MPTTVNESLRDAFLTHSIGLDRLTAHQVNEMLKLMQGAEREILTMLGRRARRFQFYGTDTGPETTRLLTQALREIRGILTRYSPMLHDGLTRELEQMSAYEAEFVRSRLEESIPRNVAPFTSIHSVNPDILHAIATSAPFQGHRLATYFGDGPKGFAAGVQRGLRKGIRRGLSIGLPPAQIVRNLERDGIRMARRNLTAITRTATQHILNSAAEKVYEANAGDDGVLKALMWLSTLDMRTTLEFCVPRDHATYDIKTKRGINARGKAYPWKEGPGRIHWACRSKSSPVTKSWKELGIKAKEIQRRDRASMDGRVPQKTNAESWMKQQLKNPKRDQVVRMKVKNKTRPGYHTELRPVTRGEKLEALYGRRRMEAWERGEITLDKMLTGDGRMLTLQELGLLEGRGAFLASDGVGLTTYIQEHKNFRIQEIRAAERAIINEEIEYGLAFDNKGGLLEISSGNEFSVGVSEKTRAALKGGTYTHNHPPGSSSLSIDDLVFAARHNLEEMRAVIRWEDGTYHLAKIRRPKAGWIDHEDIFQLAKNTYRESHLRHLDRFLEGGLTKWEARWLQNHTALLELAEQGYFQYIVESFR